MVSNTEKTKEFVKQAFIRNPHYSFNDWKIMYDHSITVYEVALRIAKDVPCDVEVLSIGALLHDIGKTVKADEATLRKKHSELGAVASEEFLNRLDLTSERKARIMSLFSPDCELVEKKIIEDADIVSFYMDDRLADAFEEWAKSRGLYSEFSRKLGNIGKLRFDASRTMALPYYDKLSLKWGKYCKEKTS